MWQSNVSVDGGSGQANSCAQENNSGGSSRCAGGRQQARMKEPSGGTKAVHRPGTDTEYHAGE
jgi:hypothetical protein